MFITFEGLDSCGKSSQIAFFAEFLADAGIEVEATFEPGGSALSCRVRELLLSGQAEDAGAETLLFCAARRAHIAEKILPALRRGAWVLCDRYSDSTYAYQGVKLDENFDESDLREAIALGEKGAKPDLTFFLDVSPEEALKRRVKAADAFEAQARLRAEEIRRRFVARAQAEPARIRVLPQDNFPATAARVAAIMAEEMPQSPLAAVLGDVEENAARFFEKMREKA